MMKFKDFLVVAMVALATSAAIFEIGAGSSPSVRHPLPAQLSALASTSLPPAQPESLAGSKISKGAVPSKTVPSGTTTQHTKHKNVAPEKSGARLPSRLSKDQLRSEVRKALPKISSKEVDAAVWIIWKESTGRLYARNTRSSSHGLNGFLRGTWRTVTSRSGIRHGYDPCTQIVAMYHYTYPRYGSFAGAKAHHVRKGWY